MKATTTTAVRAIGRFETPEAADATRTPAATRDAQMRAWSSKVTLGTACSCKRPSDIRGHETEIAGDGLAGRFGCA